jgi:hypothetical protein
MKKLWIIAAAAGIAVAAGVGVSTARSAAGSHQLTHLRYATSFGNFGRDAYVYVAIAKGYFKAAGFDVTVTAGNGSEDACAARGSALPRSTPEPTPHQAFSCSDAEKGGQQGQASSRASP